MPAVGSDSFFFPSCGWEKPRTSRGPDLEAERDAAAFPLVVLGAGLHAVARVDMDADAAGGKLLLERVGGREDGGTLVVGLVDRHDDDLDRRQVAAGRPARCRRRGS